MINLYNAQIDHVSVHKVGNKARNERLIYSNGSISLNDEYAAIFKEFFLKSFREKEEAYYCFSDTNVQIKMDFINAESAKKIIEKGWDEDRQMYYYLVYFNQEN